jgi:hypothetical protein
VRDEKDGWTREDTVDRELGMSAPITRRGDHPGSFDVAHQRAWKPYIDAAIDQAHRAVGELVEAGLV